MGALHSSLMAALPFIPTPLMRRLAGRYIAGETLEEALSQLAFLQAKGHPGALDILGESVSTEAEAREIAAAYSAAAAALAERGLNTYISIKPTHLGLSISEELCLELYSAVISRAAERGIFVRIEMEDATTTDATLRVYETLLAEDSAHVEGVGAAFPGLGIVLQARLRRTPQDIEALSPGAHDVRIVKGVYLEREEIAHTEADDIRQAYTDAAQALFLRGARACLATHDQAMAEVLIGLVREHRVPTDRYEFQVLMGVQRLLWERWREDGHSVRVYVPYGPDWRAYSTRRLGKNPEILGHVVRATFGRA